jgi:transposase
MKGKAGRRRAKGVRDFVMVQPNAAGIDVGSREHYVAVPPHLEGETVRKFGCYTSELLRLAAWLRECCVDTVALESTGVYWIPLYELLEDQGFEVVLVDARQLRSVSGRKTDVLDCQWIQQLHSYGLLKPAFRPKRETTVLRGYWRQRRNLVELCAEQIQHMQRALEQMNVQLNKVVTDITGVTGLTIIRAIVSGERDPKALAKLRQDGCKLAEEEFVDALTGTYRSEHLFVLKQSLATFDFVQQQIMECDRQIEQAMTSLPTSARGEMLVPTPRRSGYRRKNQPHFNIYAELVRIGGVDLTDIEGIQVSTAMTTMTELGTDVSKFPNDKHFTSWLGLASNNRITGGKIRSRRTRRVRNRLADAFRLAAQSVGRSDTALGAFYRRKAAQIGSPKAITATARKIAQRVYWLLKYGRQYVHQGEEQYKQQQQERELRVLVRRAAKRGLALVAIDTGEIMTNTPA